MNVFENLIEELRDENLLENTIIDRTRAVVTETDSGPPVGNFGLGNHDTRWGFTNESGSVSDLPVGTEEEDGRDFYRKRAMDEISSLQMVEHVLSGIEREHMKVVPATYNDLPAKKALHKFLQVQGDSATTEYAQAEFQLMHETEAWSSSLSARDSRVSVANLRRFCEDSRPVLSSQALLSLARFYRNSAFTELTRAKFDFVMTRLFSRETEGEKRNLLFNRAEMIGHIRTLYANWASIALYSADNVPLKAKAIVTGLEDRIAEAESSLTFDQLIQNDFFKNVHEFKESTGEVFFTPEVVAAAIDSNTRVGNKFVDLIRLEGDRTNLKSVEEKYGYEYDHIISDTAGKTLQVAQVLNSPPAPGDSVDVVASRSPEGGARNAKPKKDKEPFITLELFAVNKWLLFATIVVVLVSGGLYFWAGKPSTETTSAENAKDVTLDGSELKDYVRSGRSTSETFYAIALPVWDRIDEGKKREILQLGLEFAKKNGQKNVQFLNVQGRSVAFASPKRSELLNP